MRFRAAVRVDAELDAKAHLWLRVDRPNRQAGFFENMRDHPITSDQWRSYEIVAPIAADAESVNFGVLMPGQGRIWIDEVELTVEGDTGPAVFAEDFEEDRAAGAGLMHTSPPGLYELDPKASGALSGRHCALLSSKTAGDVPAELLRPAPIRLGAGVSALLPFALAVEAGRTLPPGPAQTPTSEGALSANDRSTRLAAVALAWNVFQHCYPYFDVVETNWDEALPQALTQAAVADGELAFLGALRQLVAKLQDGHGRVSHSSESIRKPPFYWEWIEGRLAITHVMDGWDVDLAVGDIVRAIDGKPAIEAIGEAEQLVSASTDAHRRLRTLRTMLSGVPDSALSLEVEDANGGRRTVSVARSVPPNQYREKVPPPKWREIEPGAFYVALFRITQQEMEDLVPRLASAGKVIFDLRGYPRVRPSTIGHLIDEPVTCAQWHVPRIQRPDRERVDFDFSNWTVQPQSPRLEGRVAFLTDERAISYAETHLGIIEHYDLAEIVGSPTAGTNGNVNPFTLPGGYRVSWTGMKVLKHDGSRHHGVGIQPTVRVRPTLAGVRAGRDEVLERALEVLSQ